MVIKKLSLIGGCLFFLATSFLLAADDAGGKSGLSVTTVESYQIRNKKFGDLLRPENANAADGTRIVLYLAEPWKCMTWKLQPVGKTSFHIQNHFTAKTFIVKPGDGAKGVIQIKSAHNAEDRPLWNFIKLAGGSYKITDAKSGDVLTAVTDTRGSARVVAAPWQNKDEQKWSLEKIDPATLTM